jgi:hypothetical protein
MSVIPAAMFIEMAVDMLKTMNPEQREYQLKEAKFAMGDIANDDWLKGYEVGLETMRALLAGNPTAVQAGVDL